ncbi:MAG TPA: hypothetical protein VFQ53_24395 [Kofleriaceae bacterium]|nr:hypothetical protein [Kofleriaceae bacterium]
MRCLAWLLLWCGACSFAYGPSPQAVRAPTECDTHWRDTDLALAGLLTASGVIGLVYFNKTRCDDKVVCGGGDDQNIDNDLGSLVSAVMLLGGLAHAVSAAHGREGVAHCEALRAREAAAAHASTERRAEAWRLTKLAIDAAAHDDCAVVKQQDARVRELDPDFHATVFARNVALQRCLEAAAAPP